MTLPMVHPPIETYQGSAFILGIMKAYKNTENVFYNHYINLVCNDVSEISAISLTFLNSLWEYYRINGLAEMNLYHIGSIEKGAIFNFLKEHIEQRNYLIFYNVDEYYLSYSKNYQSRHFIHDTYVYGYEGTLLNVMAYRTGKLAELEVPYQEIVDALYSKAEGRENISFCTFRPNPATYVDIDYRRIKQEYRNYFQSVSSSDSLSDKVYGINIYHVLIRCLEKMKDKDNSEIRLVDLRIFRCFWEHKKVMKERYEKLRGDCATKTAGYDLLVEIETIANTVFMLMIKFNISPDEALINRVLEYLCDMRQKERQWYEIEIMDAY